MFRRSLSLLLAAACGGTPKSTTAPPPLEGAAESAPAPDASTETKEDKPSAETPPPPPQVTGPLDVTILAPKVAVKLVSPGKGKREPLKVAPKVGDQQSVELALDFGGATTAPPEAPEQVRGKKEEVMPTVVLTGKAEVKSVDATVIAAYELTVSGTDVRDQPGQRIPSLMMKKALESLNALKIAGTIAANGVASDLALHVDKGTEDAAGLLGLVRAESLPSWPVLPTEPIGVGAKWQVTATTKLLDKLDITQTTDYELVKHEGKTWTIKGTTKVSGTDQTADASTKISNINGSGTLDVAMIDGALYPAMKAQLMMGFTETITKPPQGAPPDMPPSLQITFELRQGAVVTPNPAPAAAPASPPPAPSASPTNATPAPTLTPGR